MYDDTLLAPRPAALPAADPTSETGIAAALARKLSHHAPLSLEERASLDRLLARDVRRLQPRTALVEQGQAPGEIHVMLEGWACRHVATEEGRRRIVAFYLPGDVCDFDVFLMHAIDQSISAIGPVRIAGVNRATLNELSQTQPRISQGLWWESLVAAAVQRAWTINAGRRSAQARIAHLLCELYARLTLVGLAAGGACDVPLTQADIADACALTAIHTNRALQDMRGQGLIAFADARLTIRDWDALAALAGFDGGYLQVPQFRARADAALPAIGV